ncbi:membrane protein [Luteimonas padinae]|uniref:LemA family protein n=1 Tax=Luteimonas padinae TaxID=1714359 RepID=A0ABV6STF3_9GAMM|nr:LemA family protein [Luteimonas padinae]GHD64537.1 membrane protein [Luteimonas padinae]
MTALLVAAVALAALAAWAIAAYNRLVRLRNQVATAWSDIDVQLQRRHDLVPQLVAAVQGYASHEGAVLEAVTALRTRALALRDPAELGQVEAELEQALGRLLLLREAYPDLKASQNFAALQQDLVDVEEQLQYARRFYNGAVRDLNDGVQRVPDVLVARTFGFGEAAFFQAGADSREAPAVDLSR